MSNQTTNSDTDMLVKMVEGLLPDSSSYEVQSYAENLPEDIDAAMDRFVRDLEIDDWLEKAMRLRKVDIQAMLYEIAERYEADEKEASEAATDTMMDLRADTGWPM